MSNCAKQLIGTSLLKLTSSDKDSLWEDNSGTRSLPWEEKFRDSEDTKKKWRLIRDELKAGLHNMPASIEALVTKARVLRLPNISKGGYSPHAATMVTKEDLDTMRMTHYPPHTPIFPGHRILRHNHPSMFSTSVTHNPPQNSKLRKISVIQTVMCHSSPFVWFFFFF